MTPGDVGWLYDDASHEAGAYIVIDAHAWRAGDDIHRLGHELYVRFDDDGQPTVELA